MARPRCETPLVRHGRKLSFVCLFWYLTFIASQLSFCLSLDSVPPPPTQSPFSKIPEVQNSTIHEYHHNLYSALWICPTMCSTIVNMKCLNCDHWDCSMGALNLFLGVCISELVLKFCLPFTSGQMKKTHKLQTALNKEFGAYNSRCFSRGVQKA